MRVLTSRIVAVLVVLVLVGCAQNPPAPVVDKTAHIPPAGTRSGANPTQEALAAPGHYIVAVGDTLYSIAFRKQLDWKALAGWNGIVAPYTIVPGQDLTLSGPPAVATSGGVQTFGAGTAAVVTEPLVTQPIAGESAAPTETTTDTAPSPAVPSPSATAAAPPPAVEPAAPAAPVPTREAPSREVAGIAWSWPADGKLLSRYAANDPTLQGINIGGRRGDPVRAAADGVVVYSGNGLVGYGELIIVKHSDAYLSAYGHNDSRLVKEGERVRRGQKIATMGSSGSDRVELHFEVRKHGQPIDPQGFLPAR